MRSAGQDWYEQGDIWARVAEVDTGPATPLMGPTGQLVNIAAWAAAFHAAGTQLGQLARTGTLRRGLRAVLTHHVIFHWNRIGLPYNTQSLLAHTAKEVILGG
jgi:thiopeptide-type bacteriocin biosynthesis protein